MKIAYFDCNYGTAGDMTLGALIDVGAPFAPIKRLVETGLGVEGLRLSRRRLSRAGVGGTRVIVKVDHEKDKHRHLRHILEIINGADLPEAVKHNASEAYRRIAVAEAKVHGSTPEKIHFHEVGCLDAIADVAGSMYALHLLGVERVESSRLVVGSGTTRSAHGVIPIPAPATVEILRGVPTEGGPHAFEQTTPTGAAILTAVVEAWGAQPLMRVEAVGYGAGKREIEKEANFLRVMIGEGIPSPSRPSPEQGRLLLMTCEIDDMTGEMLGAAMTRLFEAGALDAVFVPVQMKKNRPGTQIQVLCEPGARSSISEVLLRETTTFGFKILEVERVALDRRIETVDTPHGRIDVKIGAWGGETLKASPEYESCRKAAERSGAPLTDVFQAAHAAVLKSLAPARKPKRASSRKKKAR